MHREKGKENEWFSCECAQTDAESLHRKFLTSYQRIWRNFQVLWSQQTKKKTNRSGVSPPSMSVTAYLQWRLADHAICLKPCLHDKYEESSCVTLLESKQVNTHLQRWPHVPAAISASLFCWSDSSKFAKYPSLNYDGIKIQLANKAAMSKWVTVTFVFSSSIRLCPGEGENK